MPLQEDLDAVYLGTAYLHSRLSHARRKKVGAVLVTKHGVIVPGYNGTVAGADNNCEDLVDSTLVTKPGVLHAETNILVKCSKEGISTEGATLYITLSPCERCAAMIAAAGIKRVVYSEKYRNSAGITALYGYNVHTEAALNEQSSYEEFKE
jgi:dCMP deaminase